MRNLTVSLILAVLLLATVMVGVTLADEPEPWLTLVQPHAGPPSDGDIDGRVSRTRIDWQARHTGPNPRAYQRLMMNEARALALGKSPKAAGLDVVSGTGKLLIFLIEFNPSANDVFTDFVAPDYDGNCFTVTHTFNGPLHNQMSQPGPRDNNTLWLESFPVSYYEDVVFGDGSTEITVRGETHPNSMTVKLLSLAQYYDEASRGTYAITGTVVPTWFTLPHSEAWYGAAACAEGATGMGGHPDNPLGVQQAVIDAMDAFNVISQTLVPGFDWADYDTDGNGIVDHLVVIKAGPGAEAGDFLTDTFRIWSHSSDVMPAQGGYEVAPGIVAMNYTMQPENVEVGVLAHEFGHDLGLPDLYDTSGGGTSDVVWWDLMNTGSHPGPGAIGTMPTHLSSWNKFLFGWIDPLMLTSTSPLTEAVIGQTSNPPADTEDAIFIMLPDQIGEFHTPHSGSKVWWSNFDVAWGDARLGHDVDVTTASGTITMTYWLNYFIEEDWDFLFIEASDDGGTNWTELQAWDATTGITVTTPDDYADPNGRMVDYGNKKYGISGDTHGAWVQLYSDLSAYAGEDIKIRFRYCTDAGYQADGASLDDVAVPAIGWADDMEGDVSDWDLDVSSFAGAAPGLGWEWLTDGKKSFFQYYVAEWRNYDGFDEGLKYAYQTWLYDDVDEWAVNKMQANAPGMLVWYRNGRYQDNHVTSHAWDAPSTGSKGMLLLVDSHYYPYVRPEDNGPFALYNLPGRPQSTDIAFNLWGTHPFTVNAPITIDNPDDPITPTLYPAREAVPAFHDSQGYFPGLGWLYWIDGDASVVLPSVDNQVYSTRIVTETGSPPLFDYEPLSDFYGIDLWGDGLTILGSGNPGDDEAQFGWHARLVGEATDHTWAKLRIWNSLKELDSAFSADAATAALDDELTYTYHITQNIGSRVDAFTAIPLDTTRVQYVPDSAFGGAVPMPTGLTVQQLADIYAQGGRSALAEMTSSAADEVGAIAWIGSLGSGMGDIDFGFSVKVKIVSGQVDMAASLYDEGEIFQTTHADTVNVVAAQTIYLPLIIRGG